MQVLRKNVCFEEELESVGELTEGWRWSRGWKATGQGEAKFLQRGPKLETISEWRAKYILYVKSLNANTQA